MDNYYVICMDFWLIDEDAQDDQREFTDLFQRSAAFSMSDEAMLFSAGKARVFCLRSRFIWQRLWRTCRNRSDKTNNYWPRALPLQLSE